MSSKIFIALATIILYAQVFSQQWVTNQNPIFQGNYPKPSLGITFTDPHFNTHITRITDARSLHIPGIVPNYAKRQAWNSNETRIMLQSGAGEFRLYNGQAPYQFISTLPGVEGEDVFWHATDPNKVIYNPSNALYSYDINTNQSVLIHSFNNYLYANTRGEGNLSDDGRYYAFVGMANDSTFNSLNVFDLQTNSIVSSLQLPNNLQSFDWVSISRSGNYVVVDYADYVSGRYHGVECYTRAFNFIWQKPLGYGHSDLGIDENGNDILVMDVYDADSNMAFYKKFNLINGAETTLLATSPFFYDHISCRSEMLRSYCLVSTFDNTGRLTADSATWLPFEMEVFALKLDGSRQVARIAHHHSRRFSPITPDPDSSIYWAEPHATISRHGDRVLWGSNWEQNVQSDTSIDTYICDFRNFPPIGIINILRKEESFSLSQNYPNPFNPITKIRFSIPTPLHPPFGQRGEGVAGGFVTLKIYDILGREVATLVNERLSPGTYEVEWDGSNYPSGVYFYKLTADSFSETKKMVLNK